MRHCHNQRQSSHGGWFTLAISALQIQVFDCLLYRFFRSTATCTQLTDVHTTQQYNRKTLQVLARNVCGKILLSTGPLCRRVLHSHSISLRFSKTALVWRIGRSIGNSPACSAEDRWHSRSGQLYFPIKAT